MGKLLGRTRRGAEEGMDRRSAANSLHHRPFWCLAVSGNLGSARVYCMLEFTCVQRGVVVVASHSAALGLRQETVYVHYSKRSMQRVVKMQGLQRWGTQRVLL